MSRVSGSLSYLLRCVGTSLGLKLGRGTIARKDVREGLRGVPRVGDCMRGL